VPGSLLAKRSEAPLSAIEASPLVFFGESLNTFRASLSPPPQKSRLPLSPAAPAARPHASINKKGPPHKLWKPPKGLLSQVRLFGPPARAAVLAGPDRSSASRGGGLLSALRPFEPNHWQRGLSNPAGQLPGSRAQVPGRRLKALPPFFSYPAGRLRGRSLSSWPGCAAGHCKGRGLPRKSPVSP
jgi:hypothetical protein